MSIDRETYIGPYAECSPCLSLDVDEILKLLKEQLVPPHSGKYEKWSKKNKKHLWISNIRSFGNIILRTLSFDPDETDWIMDEINEDMIPNESYEFEQFYKKENEVLKEIYGEKNVVIKWGVIHMTW